MHEDCSNNVKPKYVKNICSLCPKHSFFVPSFISGGWLLVQNGHLALDFLEELLNSILDTDNVHESFRLWMTTEIHIKFPINLLQTSIKYTFEPPQGVKAGLKRTYTNITQVG